MKYRSYLPSSTLPWKLGDRVPSVGSIVAVHDGVYAQLAPNGDLEGLALCRAGRVQATLRLVAQGIVLGRYEDSGSAQEYQTDGGRDYLEDFGGRVEGPAYATSKSFKEWVKEKIESVCLATAEVGTRPNPGVFLSDHPKEFFGLKPLRLSSGTATLTGFYPTLLVYRLPEPKDQESILSAAANLYLTAPTLEVLEQSTQATGRIQTISYQRVYCRADDGERPLFLSVFIEESLTKVVLGFCSWAERGTAQQELLVAQKLALQSLVFRGA